MDKDEMNQQFKDACRESYFREGTERLKTRLNNLLTQCEHFQCALSEDGSNQSNLIKTKKYLTLTFAKVQIALDELINLQ